MNPTDWIVLKFGGTSVSRRNRWNIIGQLMRKRMQDEQVRVLVVVSALSGVTNTLQSIIDQYADRTAVQTLVDGLVEKHRGFCAELEIDADKVLSKRFETLQALVDDSRRVQAELSWQAEVLAQGELLSSTLGVAYLCTQGMDVHWCDARDGLKAVLMPHQTAWAQRLSVSCDYQTTANVEPMFAGGASLYITQGFIARHPDGNTAILGRGGSDTSAAYFGALLKARRVEIWTDVPGMFSANPRAVPQARLLSKLDYEEAQEIASTGAKVLHPRCIHPCRDLRVPIWIRDTERPDMLGTVIDDRSASVAGVKAISSRRGIVLVSMETIGMWQQVGFLADVFERFKKHGLSVDLIGSSEANVTVSLDPSDNLVNSNVLDALCADLSEVCRVKVIAPCSAITLVGRGMRSLLHKLTDVWSEFGRERVHLLSQSSNDLNLTFVVDEAFADDLMPTLHALLIASGAMPVDEGQVFGPSWNQIESAQKERIVTWWQTKRDRLIGMAVKHTPLYVYDLPTVRAQAKALKALPAIDRHFYAIKANSHPQILQTLYAEGFGLECVSQAELQHVFASVPNIKPGDILFTPSFAPRSEYAFAFERGVNVTIDSVTCLQQWPDVFADKNIILRIDPGFGQGHHAKVRTGGKEAKFGLAINDVPGFDAEAKKLNTRVIGLHSHIGSGIVDAQHWATVYSQLAAIADRLGTVSSIDVGGGIAIPYKHDDAEFDLQAYNAVLAELKAAYPQYQLWVEPGRFMVAQAGVLLAKVTQTNTKQGVRRVGLDAGMNALMRPALYDAWHEIVNLSRLDEPDGDIVEVVGPICESSDVLGHRRCLPNTTSENDIVLIANAGAYGYAMANRYNLRELPQEEIIND
ncbi:MAG TPA: bifunctional aspartate kinase/diaminopimelate decarboxylase [Arenimonas sp.]|nr:bifunctional aspartate kinase/diaminopimelate decarboxylase [Arenimonas sp.]